MRFVHLAAALCLGAGIQLAWAAADDEPASHPAAVEKNSAAADEAAQRHIKRTACLREVREKKLLGAAKTAYLRSCIAAP